MIITEQKILNIIYSDYDSSQIEKKEDPDYYLLHKLGYRFGVEITRYFHTESSARLKYIPNYGIDLLNGKPYRHKGDKTELPVKDMIIKPSDEKSERKIKGIFHEGKSLSVISKNIADIIKSKNRKYSKYNKKLTHINLLVYDSEDCFQSIEKKSFYNLLMADVIITETKNSPFREIFFITKNREKILG